MLSIGLNVIITGKLVLSAHICTFLSNCCFVSGSRNDSVDVRTIKRLELYLVLKSDSFLKFSSSKCIERLFKYILNKLNIENFGEDFEKSVKLTTKVFVAKLFAKWKQCHRIHDRLIKNHHDWLNEEFKVPNIQGDQQPLSKEPVSGRPKKDFKISSLRSKQRSVKTLVKNLSPEQLSFATESSLVMSGKRRAAKVMKLALESSPRSLKRMQQSKSNTPSFTPYTPVEALALIVDTSMTKEDYLKVQRGAKARGANIYPAYNQILQIKQTCYPENVTISDIEARIPIQKVLDHTVTRLFEVQKEVISLHLPPEVFEIDVYYKWGLDGSGGHSIYKQHFADSPKYSDSNIILSTIVPLEMSIFHEGEKKIFWKNPSPSSTKWCRPIGFKLIKETNETIKQEFDATEQQMRAVTSTTISLQEKSLTFEHHPICTMMDGKTCNVLTKTASSQACNICKVTPKDINNLDKVLQRSCDVSAYKYGISILHAYLRCFEYLLHISYKIDIKQWQARGTALKDQVKEKKTKITDLFYEKMGLVVDQPKQGGGNTNDGNTARNFFENPEIVAEITDIDKDLIERFSNILKTISSGHYININTFRPYCMETAKKCIELYGWYRMSASVHKLLIHSSDIIKSLPLPVGQLSEDVLETSQKEYKNIRLMHSRKTSRNNTNTDILHWLCINSDPIISQHRPVNKKRMAGFNNVIMNMLTMPMYLGSNQNEEDDDEEEET